jgi:hypothetical protein
MGKSTFVDVVTRLAGKLGAPGRILAADPAQGRERALVDWQDGTTHLRVIDRSSEAIPTVGVVVEDRSTLGNIGTLRANKAEDPMAMDPSISQATRGVGRVDQAAARDAGAPKDAGAKK